MYVARWGYYSVLEPELICLSDLWEFGSWKYFINLSGMEFPLKTNGDLVKILKAYNGSNELEGKTVKQYVVAVVFSLRGLCHIGIDSSNRFVFL